MVQAQARTLGKPGSDPGDGPPRGGRIEAIDLARGIAVALMIVSHGVKGLLPYEDFTDWGLVPIHLITKMSSSLFILVFGVALGVAFLPHTDAGDWPRRRRKLLLSGVVVFFWYKLLTIVEMAALSPPSDIVDTLLYRSFPSFVEILGFYAIALMTWVPFLLPLWRRMSLLLRLLMIVLLVVGSAWLTRHFDFWGIPQLEAILVERDDYYSWGQLSRAPLVLLGLLIGEQVGAHYHRLSGRLWISGGVAALAAVLLGCFVLLGWGELASHLDDIAHNGGKHPPGLMFMLYSLGGALLLLALSLLGGNLLSRLLAPFTIIGSDALKAFTFHIFIIFIVFRYLLGYWHAISYHHALTLAVILVFATALWIKSSDWVLKHS